MHFRPTSSEGTYVTVRARIATSAIRRTERYLEVAVLMQVQHDVAPRRRALGLTQEALARAADCSLGSVRRIERGPDLVRSSVLRRVLRVLNSAERRAVA